MPKIIAALGGPEPRHTRTNRLPQQLARAAARFAQEGLQRRKGVLDRIEIRTVFRQKPELRADRFDRLANRWTAVTRQVIHDHEIAGMERRDEHLLDVRAEAGAIDRPVKHRGRRQAGDAERAEKRRRVPAPVRRVIGDACAVEAASIAAHEIGAHAAFIEKHESGRIESWCRHLPCRTRGGDVSAVVLGRAYRFF